MTHTLIQSRVDTFEAHAQRTDDGAEYWLELDIQHWLSYAEWRNLAFVLSKAIVATLSRQFSLLRTGTSQSHYPNGHLSARKSQLGSDPFAPLLAFCFAPLAFGVRP